MLERKALRQFEEWLEAPNPKALLVKGARQVGKSYLCRHFALEHFENVVVFDLIENPETRASFARASNAEDLLLRMSIAADAPLEAGKTAIIIDEVQECPNILTFIKYLVQRGDYRYILTGSLLGVKLEGIDSLPVGSLTQVEMAPLDFEEFCWATGLTKQALAIAREHASRLEEVPDYLHERLMGLFHRYLMVGGMPDAVTTYVASREIDGVRTVHQNLHALYKDDISKHAPKELRLILHDIYDLIPSEVVGRTRRFKLSDIKDVRRFDQVHHHFLWLTSAGVALPVYNVTAPVAPLLVNEQHNLFKLFYLDAGMLASSYPKSSYAGILEGKADMNMGGVYEAFVAQQLKARGISLRYFSSRKVGELDFLVETPAGAITAVEVKSGSQYRTHAALNNALAVKEYDIDRAYVLAETNVSSEGKVVYLPIYLADMLAGE